MQVPAAAAFALDGALMGASDFRYLQWGMLACLVAFAPWALVVLRFHGLGIAGIWGGLVGWMTLRAVLNVHRSRTGGPRNALAVEGRW
jgi:Na+-driven multidrug efflux pump